MNQQLTPVPNSPGPLPEAQAGRLAALRARLPRFEDEKQKRAGGNILRFLAVLVLLTIIAQGTAGATMATVQTTGLSSGEILQQVSATGRVLAAGTTTVKAPAGLTVEQMLTAAGEKLEAGDPLARFDTSEVERQLARARNTLSELNLQLEALRRTKNHDSTGLTSAQNSLAWAEQDYNTTKANGEAAVASAQSALDEARAALSRAEHALAEADEETQAAAAALVSQCRDTVAAAEQGVADAQSSLNDALNNAAREVERNKNALASQQLADEEARQSAADQAKENNIKAEALQMDVQAQQELVDSLAALLEADGILYAPTGGIVAFAADNGADTTGAVVALENVADGYIAEATVSQREARELTPGTEVEIETASSQFSSSSVKGTLLSISEADANGNVTLRVRLPEGTTWKSGESVPLKIGLSKQSYSTVIPLSALHTDNNSYYVLVVDTTTGVLGEVNTLRAVEVELREKNDSYAAIESGALAYDDKIVSGSSKSVADGSRVRLS